MREVVNGLMSLLSTGCPWRAIPKDLPPRSTLHDYLDLWEWDGMLGRIHPCSPLRAGSRPRERPARPLPALGLPEGMRSIKDWENLNCKALAFLRLASIRHMLRRLYNPS